MLDVLGQDYIRTARAKGLRFSRIIMRHALRNSMNPVVTAVSGWFASLMAGVVFVEYIFGWKGLGYLIVNALNQYDMPVVLGSVITIASFFVLINILVDLTYSLLDPRIRKV
jgi:peptide/nickel transport system permease protein